jgi:hypothetical protein
METKFTIEIEHGDHSLGENVLSRLKAKVEYLLDDLYYEDTSIAEIRLIENPEIVYEAILYYPDNISRSVGLYTNKKDATNCGEVEFKKANNSVGWTILTRFIK